MVWGIANCVLIFECIFKVCNCIKQMGINPKMLCLKYRFLGSLKFRKYDMQRRSDFQIHLSLNHMITTHLYNTDS